MTLPSPAVKRGVGAALLAALVLRLFFLVVVPPHEQNRTTRFAGFNDEPAHANYVRYLAENHRLPVQSARITDRDAFEVYEFEYYQPPLYYILSVPFFVAGEKLEPGWGLYGVRLFSVFLAVLSLGLVALFLSRFARVDAAIVGVPLFLGLLLGHARFSALVNNDSLLWFLAIALFLLLFHAIEGGGGSLRQWALLGVVTGLGLLTKTSFLTLMPGPLLALLLCHRGRRFWSRGFSYVAISGAIAAPWWIRSKLLYDEWLAVAVAVGEPNTQLDPAFFQRFWSVSLPLMPLHFWNGFGSTFGRRSLHIVVLALSTAAVVAVALAARHWSRRLGERRTWQQTRVYFWALLASSLGNLAGYSFYCFRYSQSEIRLLFPSLIGLVYLILLPLYEITPPRHRSRLTAGLAVSALLPWIAFF